MASGSTLCPSCRKLVGMNDETCYNCGRKSPGKRSLTTDLQKKTQQFGMAKLLSGLCLLLFLATLVWDIEGIRNQGLSFLSPSVPSVFLFGASGSYPVFSIGRWWTPLSATFLHGGLLHIGFNLYWLNVFFPNGESIFGTSRTVIGFIFGSIFGFFLTSLMGMLIGPVIIFKGFTIAVGANITVGASAGIFSLLGMFVATGGSFGRMMQRYAIIFVLFGLVFSGTDNVAHIGGFIGGYLIAQAFQRVPRNDRLEGMLSMLCIVLSIASVIASVVLNLPIAQNV